MSFEGVPQVVPETAEDPVLDAEYFLNTYGLGPTDLEATVAFGTHTGTMGAMLADEKCPVGGMIAEAYAAAGIDGVQGKLDILSQLSPDFSVQISQETRDFHAGTISRDELLATGNTVADGPTDFLA